MKNIKKYAQFNPFHPVIDTIRKIDIVYNIKYVKHEIHVLLWSIDLIILKKNLAPNFKKIEPK